MRGRTALHSAKEKVNVADGTCGHYARLSVEGGHSRNERVHRKGGEKEENREQSILRDEIGAQRKKGRGRLCHVSTLAIGERTERKDRKCRRSS